MHRDVFQTIIGNSLGMVSQSPERLNLSHISDPDNTVYCFIPMRRLDVGGTLAALGSLTLRYDTWVADAERCPDDSLELLRSSLDDKRRYIRVLYGDLEQIVKLIRHADDPMHICALVFSSDEVGSEQVKNALDCVSDLIPQEMLVASQVVFYGN